MKGTREVVVRETKRRREIVVLAPKPRRHQPTFQQRAWREPNAKVYRRNSKHRNGGE